jgi:uncharacterized protein
MKKRLFCLFFGLILLFSLATPCFAGVNAPQMVDNAQLLTTEQTLELESQLKQISSRWNVAVVIVTTDHLGGKTPQAYADDYFDFGSYGKDGILFLVCMGTRQWHISTAGSCIPVFTDAGLAYMEDQFREDLKENEFYDAFTTFANLCDDFLRQADSGAPYDSENLPKEPFSWVINIAICLIIGLIIALIVTGVMRSQLKSVRPQHTARDYVRSGSLQITEAWDLYLYSHVSRRAKPKQSSGSSVHRGSSGSSHGGRGGSF